MTPRPTVLRDGGYAGPAHYRRERASAAGGEVSGGRRKFHEICGWRACVPLQLGVCEVMGRHSVPDASGRIWEGMHARGGTGSILGFDVDSDGCVEAAKRI